MHETPNRLVVESVQIGQPVATPASTVGVTSIDKQPVASATITAAGLVDDTISDTEHHGGPDQAVYVYFRDDYDHWERELERALPAGSFGENITISGVSSGDVKVGDQFTIGTAVLEAASARIPCRTFQHHVQIDDWVARFRDGRRPGVYCRVITGGEVAPGTAVQYSPAAGTVSILETQDIYYTPSADAERLRAALESPIAARTRALLTRRLENR